MPHSVGLIHDLVIPVLLVTVLIQHSVAYLLDHGIVSLLLHLILVPPPRLKVCESAL